MVEQRLGPELAMEGYVKGVPPKVGLRPPWLLLSLQGCEWLAEGTGHRWLLREGAVGPSQCHPLLHISDILPTPTRQTPLKRPSAVLTPTATHAGCEAWARPSLPSLTFLTQTPGS